MRFGYTLMTEQSSPRRLVEYAELPGPAAFAGATQFVRPEDVADSIPCGPEVAPVVEAGRAWQEAGFTDLALVQIGDAGQRPFLDGPEAELLPALRAALG